jgi:hypothetical protein
MKFDLGPRNAEFGTFNNRAEKHGDERVKAIDLPVKMAITLKELDVLVPMQEGKLSTIMYAGKKKNLTTHVLSPMFLNRKPENISIEITDKEVENKALTINECSVKDPKLTFEEGGNIYVEFKVQISKISIADLDRIILGVENKTKKFQCWANEPELAFNEGENDTGGDE